MKLRTIALIMLTIRACAPPAPEPQAVSTETTAPPPLPEGAETVVFEAPTSTAPAPTEVSAVAPNTEDTKQEETI